MITYRKAKFILIFLFTLSLSNTGWCGEIVYPWNATTAIVKAGEVPRRLDQVIENDSLSVFDVRVHLDRKSTTTIEINPRVQIQFKKEFAPQEGLVKNVEKPYRDEICLNGYWQFMPVKLSDSASAEEIKSQSLPSESGWDLTPIKIPSPWNVNGFTNGEGGDFRSYPSYPDSWKDVKAGWLKKVITVPADWSGSRIVLHFEAIAGYTKVIVNGHEAGDHFDSFLPFSLDVSEFASPGEEVEILVWVAHGSLLNEPGKYGRRNYVGGSFWGIFIAGIWQDVYLQKFPEVYVSDTYVKPWVDKDELEIEVTLTNATDKAQKVNLDADISRWISQNGKSVLDIPETNWTLGERCMSIDGGKLSLEPNSSSVFTLRTKVDGALDLWSPGSPTLYGLIVSINGKKTSLDKDYTRFGWRQFDLQGSQLLLNGEPIVLKGDSWHFMGVPQMSRRYAYAWYQMLLDANGNAVRLHAQVFPRFYLEMADEMGICILDETAIWSSDGGPKIDSESYWEACRKHVKGLVLRDRNNPSVMGWSVCNETLPVTIYVFQAPQELINRNIEEINQWVAIARENDPTRTWISGDGETMAETNLPTVIGHYGGDVELERWSSQGKPWGIGETGMAYYGTPAQVAKINGDRAYESQQGRMEGLAGEAFDLISQQRVHNASYSSIFNLAWYGLKPLALGLNDISRAPGLNDGIFFSEYVEGKAGYQPERLGPYSSTLNPGYDPTLPLYETWPLFEGVKAAFSDNYRDVVNPWKQVFDNTVRLEKLDEKQGLVFLSEGGGEMKQQFEKMAILFEPLSLKQKQLILVDGAFPPAADQKLVTSLQTALEKGSTLLFWGASDASKSLLEALSESSVEFYERPATSYIIRGQHALLNGQSNASLYFSEMSKKPVSTFSMGGDWMITSRILLEACNTDWQKWNYQGEAIKTAKVYRNEREAKAPGSVIVGQAYGKGEVLVSTIDFFKVGSQSKFMIREMISNLGGTFEGKIEDVPEALNKDGVLTHVNFYGSVKNDSREIELVFDYAPLSEEEFTRVKIGSLTKGKYWDVISADEDGVFDFLQQKLKPSNYAAGYMSFWLYSPRSLTDLLVEPDMPRLDMHFGADDALAFSLNGKPVQEYLRESGFVEDELIFEGLPLEKGWNHMLIKVGQGTGDWKCKVRFSSTKPAFMEEIKSVVDR
ncbi:MAG: glycoside hydrolase family 2 TIM barrel-domain containing protein [Bacteroides sp.]|nr:glycoside hydrolase family 2 TIM barrel-domain containing protein [Bacteroides sp.]